MKVIVDGHHHLWDTATLRYPWLDPGETAPFGDPAVLPRRYSLSDHRRAFGNIEIVQSVHIEAGSVDSDAEAHWIGGLPGSQRPSAHVAFLDVGARDLDGAIAAAAATPYTCGVRLRSRSAGFPFSPERWGTIQSALARHGLTLDLALSPEGLQKVSGMLGRWPPVDVVVNHLGMPAPADPVAWRAAMASLARYPGARIKISGLWRIDRNWDVPRLESFVRYAVDIFGPQRCLYGSNLPIEGAFCPAERQVATISEILGDCSPDELTGIFEGTAREVYGLDELVPQTGGESCVDLHLPS